MPLKEKVPVVVEEHTKCKCDCRVKEGDCKRNQIYIKSQCKCECTNFDDHSKCLAVNPCYPINVQCNVSMNEFRLQDNSKIWDSDDCTCRCRDSKECTTGTFFDESTCRCIGVI